VTSAVSSYASMTVQGTLTADPSTAYQIKFFLNPAADPSGYGQGETFLATETVTTSASGTVSFSFTFKANAPGEVASSTEHLLGQPDFVIVTGRFKTSHSWALLKTSHDVMGLVS
jgi:hypothetical protein